LVSALFQEIPIVSFWPGKMIPSVENNLPSEDSEALTSPTMRVDVESSSCRVQSIAVSVRQEPQWWAVYTASRHEKRVAEHLGARGIDCYLPLYRSRRRWKDGSKVELELPLFPGYIFVRAMRQERVRVLEVPGVLSIIGNSREALPLEDAEVEALRAGIQSRNIAPYPQLAVGQRVRVVGGLFAGWQGTSVRMKGEFRVVLTLDQIMQSFAVEIDAADVEPVRTPALAAAM
jgi:transcription antitermination factor NusG